MQLNSVGSGAGTILFGLVLLAAAFATGDSFWGDDVVSNLFASGVGRLLLGAAGVFGVIYGGVQIAGGDKRRE